jgi:DNA-directed RNA polymerase alpha subunit
MIPDLSRRSSTEDLGSLLHRAGFASLQALVDLPVGTAAQMPKVQALQVQDWQLIYEATRQLRTVKPLEYRSFGKQPDPGLAAAVQSRRALFYLTGHGISTVEELHKLAIGQLLLMGQRSWMREIPGILASLVLCAQELSARPITELQLPDYSLHCLRKAGVATIGQLQAILAKGYEEFAVQGLKRRPSWVQIEQLVALYVASHTADEAATPCAVKDQEPIAGTDAECATPPSTALSEHTTRPDTTVPQGANGDSPRDAEQAPDSKGTVPSWDTLLARTEFANHPVEELALPVRAYNCLKRRGVHTVDQLLALVPEGYGAIQNCGPKTWSEIEDGLDRFLNRHQSRLADFQSGAAPPETMEPVSIGSLNAQTEPLELPADIAEGLRYRDQATIRALAALPLYRLARIPEIAMLSDSDWFGLMQVLKLSNRPGSERRALGKDVRPHSSLLSLELTARVGNALVRGGILDLSSLAGSTLAQLAGIPNLGAKAVGELLARIRSAVDAGQIALPDISPDGPKPEATAPVAEETGDRLADTFDASMCGVNEVEATSLSLDEVEAGTPSLDEVMLAWLARLPERDRRIVEWRYGLLDGRELTLDEVRQRLDLKSRESVRQIEVRALRHLQSPGAQEIVHPLVVELHHAIIGQGGVMTGADLESELAECTEIGQINPLGVVRLLLGTSGKYIKLTGMNAWCLPHLSFLVPLVCSAVAEILREALAPIASDELLHCFRLTKLYATDPGDLDDAFVLACVRADEKIVQHEDGTLGLEVWARHWQDEIVASLRRMNKAAHYTAIANMINETLENGQRVSARAVHTRLMQHPEIFVWVGRRGTYGLREWGIERSTSYVETLTQILRDAGHPLSITEILAALVRVRPYYDEGSVQIVLGTTSCFRPFAGNTFGLAEWREEDCAAEQYRLKRLFENAEANKPTRVRLQVAESIDTVDDFIDRLRNDSRA